VSVFMSMPIFVRVHNGFPCYRIMMMISMIMILLMIVDMQLLFDKFCILGRFT